MLLTVNVGNYRISVGGFEVESCELQFQFSVSTDLSKTSDEYAVLLRSLLQEHTKDGTVTDGVIVSSVVPQITETILRTLQRISGKEPLLVGPGVKTGFSIKIDSPSELGGDIVANTAAVIEDLKRQGKEHVPSVVVDMGTVTTVSAINRGGDYVGCVILPGVRMSFDSIHGQTAQLPNVILSAPEKAIGKNSSDAIRSGVLYGTAMMLDGFVGRFAKEMKCHAEELNPVITGEYASAVAHICRHTFVREENLTLRGLCYLYRKTVLAK